MAPKRAKASSGPLGPLLKESLQVSASSGEMRVRPQNCTGTNSSLNLVLIPTWVLTERPEECNPAHPVSPLERPEPKECGRGTTPFQGLWSQKKLARLAEPRFLHRPPTPDLLNPNRARPMISGQTTPALGHQLRGPTERKLSKGLRDPQLRHHETSPGGPRCCVYHFPAATRAFNFERPCYLRGGICLKQGTPDCEPFRGPCRAFTVCCKVKGLWGRAAAEKP
ncbi:uncharacterized protein LOC131506338 isoform X1 [Neofelis nebulosa]|uniref:uncharacterized protein LOC131506338 isoform X1 n=1 Tax=Neofelis nebulosa TaxID=61452 RepID=UPI00272A40F9|nr:uncharacterized protein LOC131506338 isoform X1 [Neofelis nebulosa]XP_058575849.1 uncharacterized protein LOC131506338 isoform X1 [Neofelis nebulosa]XP_058575851.1 uncharacterized protein LOC131506338 isoform X1 [Neofelis nebulosa]